MTSAFERLQKLAEEKKLQQNPKLEVVPRVETSIVEDVYVTHPIQSNPIQSNPSNLNQNILEKKSTAPSKDYQKVPNSITRDAIPNKFFKGTSKNTYDALYLRTRGAITPTRKLKATKRELMEWVKVSDVTLFKHLKHLQQLGLIKIEFQMGAHDGSIYEVFIPEEIEPIQSNPIQSNVIQCKKVGPLPSKKVGLDWMGNPIENKDTYEFPKTSLKTNTNDDDSARTSALSVLIEKFDAASKKLTGKGISKREVKEWANLGDLLVLELEIAAKRTENISSIPAFLTEVLRRKLLNGGSSPTSKSQKAKVDDVGKPDATGEYKRKPLDAKGREAALFELQDFADDSFIEDFKKWYVKDDWDWLINEIEKTKPTQNRKKADMKVD